MRKSIFAIATTLAISGCSTATYVKLPEGSTLNLQRPGSSEFTEGRVARSPFSWSSAGGVPYALEKDGKVIQEGRIRTGFRPVSIFWPPAGAAYWPMGFALPCYDLTDEKPEACSDETYQALRKK